MILQTIVNEYEVLCDCKYLTLKPPVAEKVGSDNKKVQFSTNPNDYITRTCSH
jgi:hypothetical protein